MTLGTVLYLRRIAKETGSLVVKADSVHYLTDVWVNAGVLVSLVLVKLTGMPLFDTIISDRHRRLHGLSRASPSCATASTW